MKKTIVCLLALLLLLSGCGKSPAGGKTTARYKIMNVYENEGKYSCLAIGWEGERSELTFVGVSDARVSGWDGAKLAAADLGPGMVIDVTWDGMVAESWPCQIRVDKVVVTKQGDDLVGLYRRVLNELWEENPALNEGGERLYLDFSTLTNLTEGEKEALAYLFSCDVGLGLEYVFGTWEEPQDSLPENGVFFSIAMEEAGESSFRFDAKKWRSGLGTICFTGRTAKRGSEGVWSY